MGRSNPPDSLTWVMGSTIKQDSYLQFPLPAPPLQCHTLAFCLESLKMMGLAPPRHLLIMCCRTTLQRYREMLSHVGYCVWFLIEIEEERSNTPENSWLFQWALAILRTILQFYNHFHTCPLFLNSSHSALYKHAPEQISQPFVENALQPPKHFTLHSKVLYQQDYFVTQNTIDKKQKQLEAF